MIRVDNNKKLKCDFEELKDICKYNSEAFSNKTDFIYDKIYEKKCLNRNNENSNCDIYDCPIISLPNRRCSECIYRKKEHFITEYSCKKNLSNKTFCDTFITRNLTRKDVKKIHCNGFEILEERNNIIQEALNIYEKKNLKDEFIEKFGHKLYFGIIKDENGYIFNKDKGDVVTKLYLIEKGILCQDTQ